MQTRSQTGSNSATPLFVDVVFIGDRSGSMQSMGNGLVEGATKFVETHYGLAHESGLGGSYSLRVVSFDHESNVIYSGNATDFFGRQYYLSGVRANSAEQNQLREGLMPRGATRLYDTMLCELREQAERVNKFKASLHSSVLALNPRMVVILAVLTDGIDNISTSRVSKVRTAVKSHIKEFDASCQFIAANQDANITGARMGFPVDTCLQMDADPKHVAAAMESVTSSCVRTFSGESAGYSQAERSMSSRIPHSSWKPSYPSVPDDDDGDGMYSQPQRV